MPFWLTKMAIIPIRSVTQAFFWLKRATAVVRYTCAWMIEWEQSE